MENSEFWQFSDQLRLQTSSLANLSIGGGDSIWNDAFLSRKRQEERRNFDVSSQTQNLNQTQKQNGPILSDFNGGGNSNGSFGWKGGIGIKSSFQNNNNGNGYFNREVGKSTVGGGYRKNHNYNEDFGGKGNGAAAKKKNHHNNNNNNNNSNSNSNSNDKNAVDKRFKTLPASEALPRNEAVGGYIFVCNNDTMPENLRRELFGLPPRYRDSVRAITPGLPLFLYNYSTHQLHGIFQAASFGGSNIDPTAWEDKKCPGESRFPAQVRAKTKKVYAPLEEDSFRPILHHYDGPKFRLELSVPEALALLDKFEEDNA